MDLRNSLFGGQVRQLVYKSLDSNGKRSRAIAQNLANVTTPNYQRKEVAFEKQVQDALKLKIEGTTTHDNHKDLGRAARLAAVESFVYEPNDPTLAGEINNVDVDLEASKMAENQIQFEYNIKFAGFDKYLSAINGQAR